MVNGWQSAQQMATAAEEVYPLHPDSASVHVSVLPEEVDPLPTDSASACVSVPG